MVLLILLLAKQLWGCPLESLQFFEDSKYSQNGEDGIVMALLEIIGTGNKTFVEFGVQNGKECNSRLLRERYNFTGLMMDGDNINQDINLYKEFITTTNIIDLFKKYKVPQNVDVLSIDLDMFDWWILARILGIGEYKPRIIIVEVNPTLGISTPSLRYHYHEANSHPLVVHHPSSTSQRVWDLTRYSGANPKAFQLLGARFGYDMVYCESCGVNCFMLRRDLLPASCAAKDAIHMTGIPYRALPKIPYPCFGASTHNYVGHIVDSSRRSPVLVTDSLIELAVGDELLYMEDAELTQLMSAHSFPLLPRSIHHPFRPDFSSSRDTQRVDVADICLTTASRSADVTEEEEVSRFLSLLRSLPELESKVSLVSLCRTIDRKSREVPGVAPNCSRISDHIFHSAMRILSSLSTSQPQAEPPTTTSHTQSTSREKIVSSVEDLVLEGLQFDMSHVYLGTLMRYFRALSALSHRTALRFAHDLQSFITPTGEKGYTIIGLGLCDDEEQVAGSVQARWQLDEEGRKQVLTILRGVRQKHTFGEPFGDLSYDIFDSRRSSFPLDFVPSCAQSIISKTLERKVRATCDSRRATRSVVVFGTPFSGAEDIGDALRGLLTRESYRSDILLKNDHASALAINNRIMKIFSNCSRDLHNGGISTVGGKNSYLHCLASAYSDERIIHLEQLAAGALHPDFHSLYPTDINDIIQDMYSLHLHRPPTMLASTPTIKVFSDPFFSYSLALWTGPLAGWTVDVANTLPLQMVLPLVSPSGSLACLIQTENMSFEDAVAVYASHLRGVISSVHHVGVDKVWLLPIDSSRSGSSVDNSKERVVIDTVSWEMLIHAIGLDVITSRSANLIQFPACLGSDNDNIAELLPRWIGDCYRALRQHAIRTGGPLSGFDMDKCTGR